MTDLETARERLRAAEADEVEAQRVWREAHDARQTAIAVESFATIVLLKARDRMRNARDAVVKLERQ